MLWNAFDTHPLKFVARHQHLMAVIGLGGAQVERILQQDNRISYKKECHLPPR